MALAARVLLRWSYVGLFLWFGTQQVLHPEAWVDFLPVWTGYFPIPAEMLIQVNGWMEVCLAVLLFLGCYTRFAATMLALHLVGIAATVGGAIGVRDAVLSCIGFSLALDKPDAWTLDQQKSVTTATEPAV